MATFEEFMKVAEISIKDKTSHKRMNEIMRIMRQYKVLHGLTPEQAVEVLQALGPTYVKIGQLASNRSDRSRTARRSRRSSPTRPTPPPASRTCPTTTTPAASASTRPTRPAWRRWSATTSGPT